MCYFCSYFIGQCKSHGMPNLKVGEKYGPTMTWMERRGQVCVNSPKHCPTLLIPPPFIVSDKNSLRGYLQSFIRLLCARHYSIYIKDITVSKIDILVLMELTF